MKTRRTIAIAIATLTIAGVAGAYALRAAANNPAGARLEIVSTEGWGNGARTAATGAALRLAGVDSASTQQRNDIGATLTIGPLNGIANPYPNGWIAR